VEVEGLWPTGECGGCGKTLDRALMLRFGFYEYEESQFQVDVPLCADCSLRFFSNRGKQVIGNRIEAAMRGRWKRMQRELPLRYGMADYTVPDFDYFDFRLEGVDRPD